MKRTFKYKDHIRKWYEVDIGDILVLRDKDGAVFDVVIMTEFNTGGHKCSNCSLSKNNSPGECMHYAFSCSSEATAVSLYKSLEDL